MCESRTADPSKDLITVMVVAEDGAIYFGLFEVDCTDENITRYREMIDSVRSMGRVVVEDDVLGWFNDE
jgi:hypothetical protein